MASRWYPPRYQGLVMGIAGAGNSGMALATFFGPRLAVGLGWQSVFALALIPVALTALLVAVVGRDAPDQPPARPLREYAAPLKTRDAWWFCVFYSVTFGGFVGLSSFLSIFFHDQYGVGVIQAGNIATFSPWPARSSGRSADTLPIDSGGSACCCSSTWPWRSSWAGWPGCRRCRRRLALMFVAMALLGMGNGAVFQLVPLRYPREIGVMTGLVGAAGGLGGFLLPTLLGGLKGLTGSFAGAFLLFALAGLDCAGILAAISPVWEREFVGRGGLATQSA